MINIAIAAVAAALPAKVVKRASISPPPITDIASVMTTGITRSLGTVSRVVIIVLMYCGRIGSLSFALSFSENKRIVPLQQPEEEINIG